MRNVRILLFFLSIYLAYYFLNELENPEIGMMLVLAGAILLFNMLTYRSRQRAYIRLVEQNNLKFFISGRTLPFTAWVDELLGIADTSVVLLQRKRSILLPWRKPYKVAQTIDFAEIESVDTTKNARLYVVVNKKDGTKLEFTHPGGLRWMTFFDSKKLYGELFKYTPTRKFGEVLENKNVKVVWK